MTNFFQKFCFLETVLTIADFCQNAICDILAFSPKKNSIPKKNCQTKNGRMAREWFNCTCLLPLKNFTKITRYLDNRGWSAASGLVNSISNPQVSSYTLIQGKMAHIFFRKKVKKFARKYRGPAIYRGLTLFYPRIPPIYRVSMDIFSIFEIPKKTRHNPAIFTYHFIHYRHWSPSSSSKKNWTLILVRPP